MDNTTRPATVSWERLHEAPGERTLLQRISPAHMGLGLILVLVMMVVSSGPAAMSAKPTVLPALARGGGGGAGVEMMPTRTGVVPAAVAPTVPAQRGAAKAGAPAPASTKATPAESTLATAAPTATTAATKAPARPRTARATPWVKVGGARVSRRVRSGGIPSAAAAANLGIASGGRSSAATTDAIQMRGIPSAAAAAALGPATLPFRPTDGVTLPRSFAERDSHAVEDNYGTGVLPMEAPVQLPAMTPGQSAANAEARVIHNQLTGDPGGAPPAVGGLIVAY